MSDLFATEFVFETPNIGEPVVLSADAPYGVAGDHGRIILRRELVDVPGGHGEILERLTIRIEGLR